jgi:hypothetical protein
MKLSLGCDPEVFLVDAAGALHSAIGLIGGTKDFPRPLPLGKGFAVQEDNVAIEFNTPAAATKEDWSSNIEKTVMFLREHIEKTYGYTFSRLSAAVFPETELLDPRALEFGCDPDFNAWTGEVNPRPNAPDKRLRSCGGHVHVGYKFEDDHQVRKFMQLMDLFLGVPSVLLDKDALRKSLYGKHGAFRYKPYGGEYRTLSNFWIFDESTRLWVWDNTTKAMEALQQDFDVTPLADAIISSIDDNNAHLALDLVKTYNIPLPQHA